MFDTKLPYICRSRFYVTCPHLGASDGTVNTQQQKGYKRFATDVFELIITSWATFLCWVWFLARFVLQFF